MTVWYHLTTIFGRCFLAPRRELLLRIAGFVLISVALITTLFSAIPALAAPNVTKTIGFQGRLLNAAGVPVPDGSYNVQFKLYEGGTGTEAGNPSGTLKWTETYINDGNPTGGVSVKNGFLTVDLGERNPFGTSVDWDSDTIWLSVNVAGNTVACSDFGATGCTADGEMLPMKRISATPYAINSGSVGGKTANDLAQLGQGVQTDASNLSSLFINKTGNGNLIQLQNAATDVFTVSQNGDIGFGSAGNHNISIQGSAEDTAGRDLGISAGNGGAGLGSNGGALSLQGGNAGGTNGNGGDVVIGGGKGTGTGSDGLVIISGATFKAAEEQICGTNCAVNQANIDGNSSILLSASAPDLTLTFGNPKNTTAGRVIYVTSNGTSETFTLAINGGVGADNKITMKPNMTATLFWNGTSWTTSSLSTGDNIPLQTGEHQNVQVGNGLDDSRTTLITLDKSNTAPLITDQALLGSMYYDTTLGKVQCYEAEGWGDCGSSPDTFVSLSPEYSNSVKQGNGIGDLSSGICSSDLGISDGSASQPEICGQDETYNYYGWSSSEATKQTKSIFVSYELPSTFKEFVAESTSLLAKTDSVNANVNYQVYRKSAAGLVACGTPTIASTGIKTSWQREVIDVLNDPAECNFEAGDSIVIKITFESSNAANAYASDLKFAFTNK